MDFAGLERLVSGTCVRKIILIGAVAWLAMGSASLPAAQAPQHNLSLAGYYSRGDYGLAHDTSIRYLPLSYEYRLEGWRVGVTVPYLRIDGPGDVLVNVGGVSRPGDDPLPRQGRVTSDGVGDVLVNLTRELPALWDGGPFVDVGVELKLPTADASRGLGTGEPDGALQFDIYHSIGRSSLFATLGRRFRSDSEYFRGLRDSFFVSLGFNRPWPGQEASRWRYGLIYDFREQASTQSTDTHELLPYLSWSPGRHWTVTGYGGTGFSRDSADLAAGLQLSYEW